jgi:hypothetical protein
MDLSFCRSQGIGNQFAGDLWKQFCDGYFEVDVLLKIIVELL